MSVWHKMPDGSLIPADEWQPIETAPKDGTRFLAALNNGRVTLLSANSAVERGSRFSWWKCPEGFAVPYEPSHRKADWAETTSRAQYWMPLPAHPEPSA